MDAMEQTQTLIRGPQLRKRWGMSNTAFYNKLKLGIIPKPSYPFGPHTPYWTLSDIEAFEQRRAPAKAGA
jgi:predicted DNA-binding transcriptional regulator AlpA